MPDGNSNGGGEHGVTHIEVDTVILTYSRAIDRFEISGHAESLELTLDMLGRARRAVEFQIRKAQALEIQRAAIQAAEDARIAAALRNQR